jgi:hypothetical protein
MKVVTNRSQFKDRHQTCANLQRQESSNDEDQRRCKADS